MWFWVCSKLSSPDRMSAVFPENDFNMASYLCRISLKGTRKICQNSLNICWSSRMPILSDLSFCTVDFLCPKRGGVSVALPGSATFIAHSVSLFWSYLLLPKHLGGYFSPRIFKTHNHKNINALSNLMSLHACITFSCKQQAHTLYRPHRETLLRVKNLMRW